jgi:SAM-dependent methyltransferase
VLEHVTDDRQALREVARVTRPGGRIFFAVPNSLDKVPQPLAAVYRWHDRRVGHLRHYAAADLTAKCNAAGLRLREAYYSAHWVKVWQLVMHTVLRSLGIDDKRLWWWMESFDTRATHRDSGMHLNLLVERA